MSMFTTRIELHQATWDDYERLHAAMAQAGFSRVITSDAGHNYQLPTAEYDLVGNYSTQDVFSSAWRAASTVGRKFAVLVTQAISRKWDGLPKVS